MSVIIKLGSGAGFTLLELIVNLAIIGILAAIAIPAYIAFKDRAKIAQARSDLHTIRLAIEQLASDTERWPGPQNIGQTADAEIWDLNSARAGLTAQLAQLYADTPAPLATIGSVAAAGSAVINNHPMALLHSHALAGAPNDYVFAALVGGDLGPRLLPIGSLAGLLWMHALKQQGVTISLRTFAGVGALVTIPSLVVSLVVLWALP